MEETLKELGFLKGGALTKTDINNNDETGAFAVALQLDPQGNTDCRNYIAFAIDGQVRCKLDECRRKYQCNGFFWTKKCVTMREARVTAEKVNESAFAGGLLLKD